MRKQCSLAPKASRARFQKGDTVTPVTTNRIQDQRIHPRIWFHHLASATGRRDHSHVTTKQPLRHTAPPRVPTTQPRTPQDLARTNTATCNQPRYQPCSPRLVPQYLPSGKLAKVPSIVTSPYLVPFHLCTLLFSSWLTIVPFPRCTLVFTFYI